MHSNPGSPASRLFGLLGWKPVKRRLVGRPDDWKWSSYPHYLTGAEGVVEIESHWLAQQKGTNGNGSQTKIYKAQGPAN
jgi:hypothetical protein